MKKSYAKDLQLTSSQSQVWDSCELPLWNFIQVITTNSLQPLIIKGNPTDQQLATAWSDIFAEYCDIYQSKNQTYVLHLQREIAHLTYKLQVIQVCIDRLIISYYEPAIAELRDYGFNYEYTPDTMLEDLQSTIAEAQYLVVQKGVKEGEYKKYIEANAESEVKETDYDDILGELGKFQGYHIRSKDLSVREYVSIFNRYKKQNS